MGTLRAAVTVRTIAVTTVALAAVVLTGCTGAGVTSGPTPTRSAAAAAGSTRAATHDAADRFAILHRAFAATDALPDYAVEPPDDMVPNSQRRAVEHDGTTYWIAAMRDGGACLIAANPDADSVENYSVSSGGPVERAAVVTSMIDEDDHMTALVSDGFTDRGTDALHELATNVWVR
jgi:hypothetical protein